MLISINVATTRFWSFKKKKIYRAYNTFITLIGFKGFDNEIFQSVYFIVLEVYERLVVNLLF